MFIPRLSANIHPVISDKKVNEHHKCDKKFKYDIHLLGNNVGTLERTIKWHNNSTSANATVISYGEISFLWLDSTYQQTSNMQYSPKNHHFLTSSFTQEVIGFRARKMVAKMTDDGISSTVTLNNKIFNYQNENQPLYDLDTFGAQMRLNLLQGKSHFTLFRQASKEIEEYQFDVYGHEVIEHKKWGKLNTIKVIEVGKHKGSVLWFSPNHDYQVVKAQLDLIFSPTVWLTHFSTLCTEK
jgi:hypothetical protein